MIGFPYDYGDELSEEKAIENFKLFLKNYGPTLCVNGILIFLPKVGYAVDKAAPTGKPGEVVPTPTDPPVFAPLVPPTNFVYSYLLLLSLGKPYLALNTALIDR